MAIWVAKRPSELGEFCTLAAERFDPRREFLLSQSSDTGGLSLGQIITLCGSKVDASTSTAQRYLILDTSDAREGVVVCKKEAVPAHQIGSTKKAIQPGDVIISRLRPYLRQVALVDAGIHNWAEDVQTICSTEFFVLRPVGELSIAFLACFLLSQPVQAVLAASQEGGHHPRFNEETLLRLPVSQRILDRRQDISHTVEESVRRYRESERAIIALIEEADQAYTDPDSTKTGLLSPVSGL
ncbi:MAG TPA: hypothetical protein VFI02_06300 [Armatimonadota bacterium]|nr:hypothetical protein [Armatimonadota bacterium]